MIPAKAAMIKLHVDELCKIPVYQCELLFKWKRRTQVGTLSSPLGLGQEGFRASSREKLGNKPELNWKGGFLHPTNHDYLYT